VKICFSIDDGPPLLLDLPRDLVPRALVPRELWEAAKRPKKRPARRGGAR
jgi:hypothetical protein